MRDHREVFGAGIMYWAVVQSAHKAHTHIRRMPEVGNAIRAQHIVDICLMLFRLVREGRREIAVQLAGDFQPGGRRERWH